MNKQQLASTIWKGLNKLRGQIDAAKYKDYILGFIFYRFLSEKEENFLFERHWEREDLKELKEEAENHVTLLKNNIGYFIPYDYLFSTWVAQEKRFDSGSVVDALNAFNRNVNKDNNAGFKKLYENIFNSLRSGINDLGSNPDNRNKAIIDIMSLVKQIPMNGEQGYDVLGFVYEYLIGMFAANAGKKAGEFYTPHEVSVLMSEIIAHHVKGRERISIYDPTSGSASLLINIGKSLSRYMENQNGVKYYAQELIDTTFNITRMNLVMRGISPSNIEARQGDSLAEDWPMVKKEENGITVLKPLWLDAVVSNPPYSQAWTPHDDPRFDEYGLAPRGKADYAFLLHALYHVKEDGIMTIVLPHGVLFRGGFNKESPDDSTDECAIRYHLIEKNQIDAIIGLPANIFFGTGIPTIIMVLKKNRTNDDILFVDASKGFAKNGNKNLLRSRDIRKIVDAVTQRIEFPNFSKKISRQTIRDNEYNLNIPRYIDSGEKAENWDLLSIMEGGVPNYELDELKDYWAVFPKLRAKLFESKNMNYSLPRVSDPKETIVKDEDVLGFSRQYEESFKSFDSYLSEKLLSNPEQVNIQELDAEITSAIFNVLENIPLVDKYQAYQLYSDIWKTISVDLEMITTEGLMKACTQVDKNMVPNKKDKNAEDVQDGWVGHIMPYDLIQRLVLTEKYNALQADSNELLSIQSSYSDILDSLSEEDKESDIVNEEKDGFVAKEVASKAKDYLKSKKVYPDDSLEFKVISVYRLSEREKELKKNVKLLTAELEDETKHTIENLSKDQVISLLREKWIVPLMDNLFRLPKMIIGELTKQINYYYSKYAKTLTSVEEDINSAEKELVSMIKELDASPDDLKGLNDLLKLLSEEK